MIDHGSMVAGHTAASLENMNPVRVDGQGDNWGRRKSAAYTAVCEHFEPTRNAAMGTQTHF